MKDRVDIVLVNPGDRRQVFQNLSDDFSAIEPPFWVAVIAAYLRRRGLNVLVIDANAEDASPAETAARIREIDPLLLAVIVYGSQPSASTQNMTIAGRICRAFRDAGSSTKVAMGGLHPSALPLRTLIEEAVDFVIEGEGPYTLTSLVEAIKSGAGDYSKVPGLWYYRNGAAEQNPKAPLIKNLDEGLPAAAWDLLPMHKYRAHNWHCFDDIKHRTPYGAIYTSLGCPYSCVFCCINAPFGKSGVRYRSPELVAKEMGLLVENYGIRNMKIVDELFVLDERHYMTIVEKLIERRYDLNIWAYARIDTVKQENLKAMKRAGINWLALGIESANPKVLGGASKRMKVCDIKKIVRSIQSEGIRVIGNYIFGLPDDDLQTMNQTLDLAMDLNCEFVNFYCAMAYPGSELYNIALQRGWRFAPEWHGFSQHSYEIEPLPTKHLTGKEVLEFRDNAFHKYFGNPAYLAMLEKRFGPKIRAHVDEMTKTRLSRRLLEGAREIEMIKGRRTN
ncbi:MAG: cobalamin B12-binding domain-containing protein [Deltaproteobacteria bacterium]|nr:cobalamin B12-binding domain-containing protein [Deltaproteobacteria bacterium]